MSTIKILYNNINSYLPKRHLINNFIEQNNVSCAMFVEAKIKDSHNTNYRDWTTIHKVGHKLQNTRGGSLVQCHPHIKCTKDNPPVINNPLNEVTHFSIPFKNEKLHIFLVYFHPTGRIEETLFTKAALYKYVMIIGDINATTASKKKIINNFIKRGQYSKAATKPTFLMDGNEDSTPDLILYTNNIKQNILKIELITDLGSDHLGMIIDVDLNIEPETQTEKVIYDYKRCKMEIINKETELFVEQNKNTHINEHYIQSFNIFLSESIKKNTPRITRHPFLHELPPYIVKLIKNKRRMYREYCSNRDPFYKREINRYNKNIHRMIQQYRENNWIEACNKINDSKGKKFYQEVNKLSKYKYHHHIPTLVENNKEFKTDQEKADLFARHYMKVYKFNEDKYFDDSTLGSINSWYHDYFENQQITVDNTTIDESDYFQLIHENKNSTPGEDNIPWIIIKKLNETIHRHLIQIYTYCLNNCIFPDIWKTGHITNIPKPNLNGNKVENYRPITLLPVLGKLYEKIIKKTLSIYLDQHIPSFQFGFKKQKSTTHPLTILVSNIQNATLKNYKTAVLSLDIKKAFDSLWHRGLLYKLYILKVPSKFIRICRQFLENRRLSVKINNNTSDYFYPQQGTPQGSPLSTLLFNIYCYDIATNINRDKYILQFADDTTLIAHNKSLKVCIQNLQSLVDGVCEWFLRWRMKPNPEKSQYIIFYHRISTSSPSIVMKGIKIVPTHSIKYLGVQIDNKLNFNLHTKMMKKKTISRAKHFSKLTYRKQGINIENATKIYKSICRPLLEYAHPLYANCKTTALRNLEVAETTALRAITRLRHPQNILHNPPNSLLYMKTNILPITERITVLNRRFHTRLNELEDVLNLYHEDGTIKTNRKHPTQTLIDRLRNL